MHTVTAVGYPADGVPGALLAALVAFTPSPRSPSRQAPGWSPHSPARRFRTDTRQPETGLLVPDHVEVLSAGARTVSCVSDEAGLEGRLRFDLLAATLRADEQDAPAFLAALAVRLEGALPRLVEVERVGGGLLHRRSRHVRSVQVTLGEQRFVAAEEAGSLRCGREHVVRGIVLRRDRLEAAAWIDELARALVGHAASAAADRAALERLLL